MNREFRFAWLLVASIALVGCSGMGGGKSYDAAGSAYATPAAASTGGALQLTGAQEVPAVTVTGSGTGTITVASDGAVSGSVRTTGVAGTAAHIHVGPAGVVGPVIIPLTKTADVYTVPPGAKLTDEQMKSYKAGNLYVNVHTAANPGGEVRAQLKP